MWVVLVLCFSLGRVAGYLYIYLPAYLCIILVYIHVYMLYTYRELYMHSCQCGRLHGGANRTATSRKLHPLEGETASNPETIPSESFQEFLGLIETATRCAPETWMLTSALLSKRASPLADVSSRCWWLLWSDSESGAELSRILLSRAIAKADSTHQVSLRGKRLHPIQRGSKEELARDF